MQERRGCRIEMLAGNIIYQDLAGMLMSLAQMTDHNAIRIPVPLTIGPNSCRACPSSSWFAWPFVGQVSFELRNQALCNSAVYRESR
jgi:hypothetical protein